MIDVRFAGRFGNQLFQYAFARIVAEELGYRLRCIDAVPPAAIEFAGMRLDSGPEATLRSLSSFFENAPLDIAGQEFSDPIEHITDLDGPVGGPLKVVDAERRAPSTNGPIEFHDLLRNRSPRHILLEGVFLRYDFYSAYTDRIKSWFQMKPMESPYDIRPNDVLLRDRKSTRLNSSHGTLSRMPSSA